MNVLSKVRSLSLVVLSAIGGVTFGAALVAAATTISTNIQTDGTLSVTGTSVLNGNVGIANASPSYPLDVTGLGHFTGLVDAANFVATSTTATSTFTGGFTAGNNAALTVNQIAPQNALYVAANGKVGIGTTTPPNKLTVNGTGNFGDGNPADGVVYANGPNNLLELHSGFAEGLAVYSHASGVFTAPTIYLYKSRGTQNVPTSPQSGDILGYLQYGGYDGSSYFQSASIESVASQNWASGNTGTNLDFYVDQNGAESLNSPIMRMANSGNVGVDTSSPYSRLQVSGPDAASSTSAFAVVNSASTTVFSVFDGGNAQLSGTLTQSSDQRLKTNIQSLDAVHALSLIEGLNPVTFNWIDPNQGSGPQVGFIAQQVQQIFPELVSTTSATALTPGGTLGLNYIGLISPIVSAIQALSSEVRNLITEVQGFAQSFTTKTLNSQQDNTHELCVINSAGTPICVTGDQLAALLASSTKGK